MKECDILGVKSYSDSSYIFSGGHDSPTPVIYAPGTILDPTAVSSFVSLRIGVQMNWYVLCVMTLTLQWNDQCYLLGVKRTVVTVFTALLRVDATLVAFFISIIFLFFLSVFIMLLLFHLHCAFCFLAKFIILPLCVVFLVFFFGQFPWMMFIVVIILSCECPLGWCRRLLVPDSERIMLSTESACLSACERNNSVSDFEESSPAWQCRRLRDKSVTIWTPCSREKVPGVHNFVSPLAPVV